MKVLISADMEGTTGVSSWVHVTPPEGAGGEPSSQTEYERARLRMTREVNAAIEGAMSAGATEVLVNDSHSSMQNLRPDELAGSARYLSGRHKPMYMMQGLDSTFDAVFFVSYHGSMGSEASTLSHTYNPRAISRVLLNGTEVGE
nr:M55 family metallopeptidase [Chloroflexia bacterium]